MSAKAAELASKSSPLEATISGMATRLEAQTKAHQSLTAELSKDNKYFETQHNPALAQELEQKLASAGFPSFTISKAGDILYNPTPVSPHSTGTTSGALLARAKVSEVATLAPVAPGATTLGPPTQSDFFSFAGLVAAKVATNSNFNVNATGFTPEFGAANATTLDRLGLTNLSLQQNHLVATFAKPGAISFGTTPLSYANTVGMNFSDVNGTLDLSNISGLKGQMWGISADLKSIDISPADSRTKLSDVKAQAQVGFVTTTIDQKLNIGA